jgi:hypothetical protein
MSCAFAAPRPAARIAAAQSPYLNIVSSLVVICRWRSVSAATGGSKERRLDEQQFS